MAKATFIPTQTKNRKRRVQNTDGISRRTFVKCVPGGAVFAAASWPTNSPAAIQGDDMSILAPYLLFDGSCESAMTFYQSCLGGDLTITKVGNSPIRDAVPASQHGKALNAHLKSVNLELFSSDWLAQDETPVRGNTVCVFLHAGSFAELEPQFKKLSVGADVTNPPKKMPVGVYAALNDKFGVRWMFMANN